MNKYLLSTTTGGYYDYVNSDGSGVDNDIEGVDQAWMQRVQALMALYR